VKLDHPRQGAPILLEHQRRIIRTLLLWRGPLLVTSRFGEVEPDDDGDGDVYDCEG
jgi:hypothetical protein